MNIWEAHLAGEERQIQGQRRGPAGGRAASFSRAGHGLGALALTNHSLSWAAAVYSAPLLGRDLWASEAPK